MDFDDILSGDLTGSRDFGGEKKKKKNNNTYTTKACLICVESGNAGKQNAPFFAMIILVDEINRSRCRCYFTTRNFFESVFRRVVTFTQGKQKIKIIKILSRLLISPSLSRVISSIESRKHGPNRKMYNRPWFQSRLKLFFFFWFKEGTGAQKKKKKKKERDSESSGTIVVSTVLYTVYIRIHPSRLYIYRYDPASMTGHCIGGIRAERLLHASEYAFTRRQTPMFGFSSTALAEIHRIHTGNTVPIFCGTRIYANFIYAFRGW